MKTKNILLKLSVIFLLILSGCSSEPEIDNATMLDGDQIFDASLYNPTTYLVSHAITNPTTVQKNTPVIITVHGYSASTFEWDEFRTYSDANANILMSQVLLGGHGRSYEDFKNATWKNWQEPITAEYNALLEKGYTNINFALSSTACPLVLDLIKNGKIADNSIKNIFLIDPIIIPSDKLLTLIGTVGPMLGYFESTNTTTEDKYWYHFKPQETLNELLDLIDIVRKDLQKGYQLPTGTQMKIYKSIKDDTADAVSAVLIYKGLKNSDKTAIDVEMIDSELHVVTRLEGRDNVTQKDRDIQKQVFDNMLMLLTQ
ncbi:alpha/beta hydrolase [Polaribacter sp. SA4-12]|uniref:alpha/beta hydrolase n=1 Tax=Polaribacter sp. SA4-12 TaxID=1312072 RepID=UPI000B3D1443|nr:esterase [Polaribacter sp. SA4-12]ARV14251.1 esterase [Polaribacter sp. SA4-12]